QHPDDIIAPDLGMIRRRQDIPGSRVGRVTCAPEGDEQGTLREALNARGSGASAGHTDAMYEPLREVETDGVSGVTHLCHRMRGLHQREPGVVGFAYMPDAFVEIISDGIHSRPEMVKLAYDNIPSDRMIMITDAMRAHGLPDGRYDLGGQEVNVVGNEARLADGTLAGSVLTMDQAVRNMLGFTGCGWPDIVKMSSYNPARELGITEQKGVIKEGADADLVLYDGKANLTQTIVKGEVFS